MNDGPKPCVVIFVNDVIRVSAIYRDLAGMRVEFADEDHVVLALDGFELVGAIEPHGFEWSARGFRACDGHDTEGNVIQVRQADS